MAAKRKFKLETFLDILAGESMSNGVIARKIKCHISTARKYLRELKTAKQPRFPLPRNELGNTGLYIF
jgi:hypothetical protein